MKIDYVKINPTENKTALVETVIERKKQVKAAKTILGFDKDLEQVGFIESPEVAEADLRLQMMGGEFCGNASISACVNEARKRNIKIGETMDIKIEVSGVDDILKCKVFRNEEGYSGKISMPLPKRIKRCQLEYDGISCEITEVILPGITHLIMSNIDISDNYEEFAEKAIKCWAEMYNEDAIGLILFDEYNFEIKPLVYVKQTDSLFWERGCGSGTAAVGAYYAYKYGGKHSINVKQPGGIIKAEALYETDSIKRLSINGKVIFEKSVSLYMDI